MMFGRRGIKRVAARGRAATPTARASARCSSACEREHGVTHYLAHNITVTPRNIDQIPQLVRDCRDMGFRMFSFQPAAFIGNEARWKDAYRAFSTDEVWRRIEEGAGARLHYNAEQVGDVRCNRTAHGIYVGDRYETLLDEDDPRDARALARLHRGVRRDGLRRRHAPPARRALRARDRPPPGGPAQRRAVGGRLVAARSAARARIARAKPKAVTYVMHAFMDARDVRPAWELLQRGERRRRPEIRATQERLQACSYAMAHPESGTLVPACAQHSVLDPLENLRLQELLPARAPAIVRRRAASPRGTLGSSHRRARVHQLQHAPTPQERRPDLRSAGRPPLAALPGSTTRPPVALSLGRGLRAWRRGRPPPTGRSAARRLRPGPRRGSASTRRTPRAEFEAQVADRPPDDTTAIAACRPDVRSRTTARWRRGHEPHGSPAPGLLRRRSTAWQASNAAAANVNSKYELYADRATRSGRPWRTDRKRLDRVLRGRASLRSPDGPRATKA